MAPIIIRVATAVMAIAMTTETGELPLLRLMTWLSPAFPVGGFAYSGGLEAAVREGHVATAGELHDWLEALLRHGSFWNDAVLLAEAWNAGTDRRRLGAAADLARALAGSRERHVETTALGEAFLAAAAPWTPIPGGVADDEAPYPVAVGAVAAANGVPLDALLAAWLHAAAAQLVSAAIRLSVLGQREATALLAAIEPTLLDVAGRAASSTLDDLGGATIIADILSARHENLHIRLFRS